LIVACAREIAGIIRRRKARKRGRRLTRRETMSSPFHEIGTEEAE